MYATALETQQLTPHGEACTRCGNFAALAPFWGRRLCTACVERESAALGRGNTGVSALLSGLSAFPARVWGVCIGLNVAANLIGALKTLAGVTAYATLTAEILILSFASAVTTLVAVQALHGRTVSVRDAARTFGQRFGTWFGISFLGGLWILALMLLLFVPGVLKALSLALLTPIVIFEPVTRAKDVFAKSTERMRGARWSAFAAYTPFFLLPILLGGVGGFFVGENPEVGGRAVSSIVELVAGALGAPATLITALLYVRRTPPDAVPVAA